MVGEVACKVMCFAPFAAFGFSATCENLGIEWLFGFVRKQTTEYFEERSLLLNWHYSVGGRNENDDIFNDPDKNLSKMHLKISVFLFYNKFPCRSKICVCVFFEWTQIMERDWEGMLAEQKVTTTHRFDICFVNADTSLVKSQYNYECNCTFLPFCFEIIWSVFAVWITIYNLTFLTYVWCVDIYCWVSEIF